MRLDRYEEPGWHILTVHDGPGGMHFFLVRFRPFIAHCWMDWWNVSIAGHVLESGKADAPQYAWLAAIKAAEHWHNPTVAPRPHRETALASDEWS